MLSQNGALARLRCMMTIRRLSARCDRACLQLPTACWVRADAEDVVQDAWLRWHGSAQEAVQSAEAWLVTITTRLAIDRLRSRRAERESYVGWWLPEPIVELDEHTPESHAELASEVSMALLWVLERLSPGERAAFLMRQVFDHDYADIAAVLGKSEAACRQMVHRAQERVQQQTPRFMYHASSIRRCWAASSSPPRSATARP
jgi:RNA polymerase sigma-70 factor (ECF subfamily)